MKMNQPAGDMELLPKCLDICQALANQGLCLTISLTMGNFTFSLDIRKSSTLETREEKDLQQEKKKNSPSNRRRNQRRKEEFLKRKSGVSSEQAEIVVEKTPEHLKTFKCDQCEMSFNTKNGLKIHKGKSHKCSLIPPSDKLFCSTEKVLEKEVSHAKECTREEEPVEQE